MSKGKRVNRINRIIRKGSLCIVLILLSLQAALAASVPKDMESFPAPPEMELDSAKNGIVRVLAGVEGEDGKITNKTNKSGFIVSMDNSNVYVITTLHSLDLGEDGRIQIAVKNDSVVDATISQKNKENDFCILSAENSFNDKEIIPLRVETFDPDDEKLKTGDEVIALGFPIQAGNSSNFDAAEVAMQKGKVTKTAAENGGNIEHDAAMPDGMDGGVLVDKDGYVVGLLNNKAEASDGLSSAKDISEIDSMLVSKGIPYRAKDKDFMYAELYKLCADAGSYYKKADKESKEEIVRTRDAAMSVLAEAPYDRDALKSALVDFNGVMDGANYKTPKLLMLIYALAAVIALLSIKLITLITWNKKNKPTVQSNEASMSWDEHTMESYPARESYSVARLRDLRTGRVLNLGSESIIIGKSAEADFRFSDNNKVSRRHAIVEKKGNNYWIRDLNSTNGTYLNSSRVGSEGSKLSSGDIIIMSGEQIEFTDR